MNLASYYITDNEEVIIDFSRTRLCTWAENINEPNHIENALEELKSIITSASFNRSFPITLDLEGNYLEDDGVCRVCEFIQGHKILKDNLKVIDISNNRFTAKSLECIQILLKVCDLTLLNLSLNYLSEKDLRKRFGEAYFSGIVKYTAF